MLRWRALVAGVLLAVGASLATAASASAFWGAALGPVVQGKVAFTQYSSEAESTWLEVANLDGSERHDVASAHGAWLMGVGPWSPDGRRLVFRRENDGGPRRRFWYVVNADGSGLHPLARRLLPAAYISSTVWSPSGAKIAFAYHRPTQTGRLKPSDVALYVVNAGGTRLRELSRALPSRLPRLWRPDVFVDVLGWSASGRVVFYAWNVFSGHAGDPGNWEYTDIYAARVNGDGRRRIGRMHWDFLPEACSVAPNGMLLACVDFDASLLDLMNLETGSRRRLLRQGLGGVAAVKWLPNNREVVFEGWDYVDDEPRLGIIDIRTGDVRELAAGPFFRPFTVGRESGLIGYGSTTFHVITPEGTEVASFPLPGPTRPGAEAGVEVFYLQ